MHVNTIIFYIIPSLFRNKVSCFVTSNRPRGPSIFRVRRHREQIASNRDLLQARECVSMCECLSVCSCECLTHGNEAFPEKNREKRRRIEYRYETIEISNVQSQCLCLSVCVHESVLQLAKVFGMHGTTTATFRAT